MLKSNRQYWILSFCLCLGLVAPPYAASQTTDAKILHVLNRLSYGPLPGDIEKVKAVGVERYIQTQLAPESLSENPNLAAKIKDFDTLQMSPADLFQEYNPPRRLNGQRPSAQEAKAARERSRRILEQAATARMLRAVESSKQLQEVMADFWFNHFNIFANKGLDRIWIGSYEEQAIRPHVLGKFRDLLGATAHHPAMLFYLDNWQNSTPNPKARGRAKGINENYARELMELHTLGVNGGYTQQDVIALAHILTGWGIARSPQQLTDNSGFYFDAKRHDFSDKVFLGQTIKGSGQAEGEQALDILARHPATARHISYQLAQYFVADEPPPTLVNRLTKSFLDTDGDIRAVLNTLFHSSEFNDAKYYNAKFKTPYQYTISALRATGVEVNNARPIAGLLMQMGMPLYGCQTPDGYKNTQETWLNPDAMTRRLSFATALASGRLPLDKIPEAKSAAIGGQNLAKPIDAGQLTATLGNQFSAKTQAAIASSPAPLRAALILGSPEFMHR